MSEARDVEVSSSGEYVNLGICRLVTLAVLLLTASTLLDEANDATEEEVGTGLLSADDGPGLDVGVEVGVVLDSFVVGLGGGVMNDVDKTVCGFCVASGEPSGLTKVMAGAIDVNIVSLMGSTIRAVSACTVFCSYDEGSVEEVLK